MAGAFLIAGGGTGGHVIPALAVGRELRRRGHRVFFAGTERGMEARLVPAEGFELRFVRIGALNRVGLLQRVATMLRLPFAIAGCLPMLRDVGAVFSVGGYAAGPAVAAALLRRTPVVVMEPNATAGFTNRVIGRWVYRALLAFPEAAGAFPAKRTEICGVPVREEFFRIAEKPRQGPFSILVTGGSQGSRTLNEAARSSWPLFRASGMDVSMTLQCGKSALEGLRAQFAETGMHGEVSAFLSDMPAAFAAADLVVCRSGASTVAELAAAGKPSVLTPFPFAADDHQTRNAEAMQRAGAARMVRDAELNGETLYRLAVELAGAPETLERMGRAARAMARPGAAGRAADALEEAARRL